MPELEAALRALIAAVTALACPVLPAPATPPSTPGVGPGIPANLTLVQEADLHYQWSFRLPWLNGLQYGGDAIAAHDGLLLVHGRGDFYVDVRIPAPGLSAYADLPVATVVNTFGALDNGLRTLNNPADTSVRGLLFAGPRLILSVAPFYGTGDAHHTSHLVRDLATGIVTAYELAPSGHTAGYMTSSYGALAPALTGNFGLPIVTRESYGPAAFIFDPQNLTKPVVPVLDYTGSHPLGPWNGTSTVWNSDSQFGGMAQIGRSLLFIGVQGLGPFCYGEAECGDRERSDHGTHTYPYTPRIWAYDTEDLVAVKNGTKQPWEPRPYGLWNLALPLATTRTRVAATYDAGSGRLFILQQFGASDPAMGMPVIHVYKVGL